MTFTSQLGECPNSGCINTLFGHSPSKGGKCPKNKFLLMKENGISNGELGQEISERQKSILKKRAAAKGNLHLQAAKMLKISNNKFPLVKVGDTVRVKVPDVDCGRTDPRNILAVITSIEDSDFFKLGNKNRTFQQQFTRNQFTICPEKLCNIEEVCSKKITFRGATVANFRSGGQGYQRCNCTKKCSIAQCSCKKNSLLLNSKCHISDPCCNK